MKKLFVLAFMVIFSASAFAAQFDTPAGKLDVYTSIRGFANFTSTTDVDGTRDDAQLKMALQGNSRLGAKINNDKLGAHVEFGGLGDEGTDGSTIKLRLAYGTYKLDNGATFKLGQFAGSSQGSYNRVGNSDGALDGFGNLAQVRRVGIGYSQSGLTLNLISLSQDSSKYAPTGDTRFKSLLPKVEAAYKIQDITLYGAFAMFEAESKSEGAGVEEYDYDATAYHVGVYYAPKFGDVTLKVNAFYSNNAFLYDQVRNGTSRYKAVFDTKGEIEDITTYGGAFAVNYKIDSNKALEVGVGYQFSESDAWKLANNKDYDDTNLAVYAQLPITIVKGFRITPEIGYLSHGTDVAKSAGAAKEVDDKNEIQALVQFRIDL
jgi:hypothetical protein